MASLGRLVAGIAHELNNPINFVHGNLPYLKQYVEELKKSNLGHR
jgi:two-component system NtrC family sensor kinase